MRGDLAAVAEADHPRGTAGLQPDDLAGGERLGTELVRLPAGPLGQLRPGYAVREAQVVLDPRALPGLPAAGHPLDHHRAQPLGRRVDRGTQPGRPGPDHHQVVEVRGRLGLHPDGGGDLGVGRRLQRLAVRSDHDGHVLRAGPGRVQQPPALRLVDAVPAVGHGVAGQEVARLIRRRRPAVSDHPALLDRRVATAQPGLDQLVDHRVELLLRRIPRLEQVVVHVDQVDRLDGGVGVGVGGEQRAAGVAGTGPSPAPGSRCRSCPASGSRRAARRPGLRAA